VRKLTGCIVAAALAAQAAFPADAAAEASNLAGVWDGTIGDLPVRMCFDLPESSDPYGVYFYRSKFLTIPLIKDDKAPSLFSEGWPSDVKAPRWALTQSDPNALGGTWKQGTRTLPLRLTRVPVAGKENPCSSMEFERPRLQGLRVVQTRASKDGVAYTKLTLDHGGHFGDDVDVQSFVLSGDTAPVRTINAVLKKPFDEKGETSWLSCVREAFPWGGDHHEIIEPRMISRHWLVVNHHWDGFCGGAHPDSSNVAETFDLTTGRKIDVRDWFNDKAIKRTRYEGDPEVFKTMQPGFRRMVIGRWKGDEECAGTIDTEEWWNVELNRIGFVFTPSLTHVVQACAEDFKVPFAKLTSYLTPEGRNNVSALQAELSANLSRR